MFIDPDDVEVELNPSTCSGDTMKYSPPAVVAGISNPTAPRDELEMDVLSLCPMETYPATWLMIRTWNVSLVKFVLTCTPLPVQLNV
jgi:hypothetical protein